MSKEAIDAGHERFLAAMRADNADGLMEEISDDVVFMPPGEPAAEGKSAVRAWYQATIAKASTVDVVVPERDVEVAGDWGIERGHFVWTLAPADGGDQIKLNGKFHAIWKRLPDGAWKVSSDIWNTDSPI